MCVCVCVVSLLLLRAVIVGVVVVVVVVMKPFSCSLGVLAGFSVFHDTAQALVFLLVSMCFMTHPKRRIVNSTSRRLASIFLRAR